VDITGQGDITGEEEGEDSEGDFQRRRRQRRRPRRCSVLWQGFKLSGEDKAREWRESRRERM